MVVAVVAWPHANPPVSAVADSCARLCYANVTAVAVWAVWNQIDCDDEDTVIGAVPVCADDAQNINRAASVRNFAVRGRFVGVTVDVEVGNVLTPWRVTVDRRTWQALTVTLR